MANSRGERINASLCKNHAYLNLKAAKDYLLVSNFAVDLKVLKNHN